MFKFHWQDFLESEGLEVNPSEEMPTDPYIERRKDAAALRTYQTPSAFDKTKQFLEMDRKVLRFYCVWDDRDNMFGETRPYVIHVSIIAISYYIQASITTMFFFSQFISNIIYFHLWNVFEILVLLGGWYSGS